MVNQFHDVLPGSGIGMVCSLTTTLIGADSSQIYEDAETKYAALAKAINGVLEEAHAVLYPKSLPVDSNESKAAEDGLFAVNTTPGISRQEVLSVRLDGHGSLKSTCAQISRNGERGYVLVEADRKGEGELLAKPKGLYAEIGQVSVKQSGVDTFEMANSSVKLTVHEGRITSLIDVALDKELIPHGKTGGMVIMEDHPNFWDAWDVNAFHLEKQTHLKFGSVGILDHGPLRATLGATVMLGQSSMDVEVSVLRLV